MALDCDVYVQYTSYRNDHQWGMPPGVTITGTTSLAPYL